MITVLAGIWTIFNGGGNFLGALIVDRVGRKLQMSTSHCLDSSEPLANSGPVVGYSALVVVLTLDCVLTIKFGGTANKAGNTAATFFIFLTLVVSVHLQYSDSRLYGLFG